MATDPAKLKDSTFRDLKKRVRQASNPEKMESKNKGEGSFQFPMKNK